MRRYAYLDHIRWMTVLLVIVYHVCYLFNGVGIFGGVPNARNLPFLDTISGTVYPWFMVLLFVVAGMCARLALVQQGNRAFLRNRARKLLVPSTLGLFVLHWVTGYLNIRMGGAMDTIPKPLLYPISVLSGIGPLWFVQLLFLFSAILVLIRRIDRNDRLFRLGERTPSWLICAFALLIWGAAQVGNMPVITTYRIGIYLTAFLLGYAVFAHEAVMARVERMRWGRWRRRSSARRRMACGQTGRISPTRHICKACGRMCTCGRWCWRCWAMRAIISIRRQRSRAFSPSGVTRCISCITPYCC